MAMPLALRRPVFGALGRAYPKLDWAPRMFRAKTTFESLARNSVDAYLNSVSFLREPLRMQLYSARFLAELDDAKCSTAMPEARAPTIRSR